jgi:Putative auto-transporter adhesin, head GIN domain
MKKIIVFLIASCFVFSTNAQNDIVVDANASVRNLTGQFDAIKISGGIDLYLSQSDNVAIAVSASDEKFKEGIKTVIEDGILKIFYKGEVSWRKKDRKLRAYVSFKDIKRLDASGACDVIVAGSLNVTTLSIQMSGACDFTGKVKADVLKLNLSGASDAKISGTAGTAVIESSGASDVKGYDLVTDICKVKVSGASDVNITVNTELSASATGASDISYKGSALIKDIHSSGASSVSRKN